MSTIEEIRARLLGPGTVFKAVEGGLELADVIDTAPKASPTGFVLVAREVAGANDRATGLVLQRVERDIKVVVAVKHAGTDKKAHADSLAVVLTWTKDRLVGFVPTDMDEPITYVEGEIVEVRNGVVWFDLTFSAPIDVEEQP